MFKNKTLGAMLLLLAACLILMQTPVQAEPPGTNIVIAAGETWGTYTPANYDYAWPRFPVQTDLSTIQYYQPQASIFLTSRMITSGLFGNPPWSWMSGRLGMDFSNGLNAVEFNSSDEFAAINGPIAGEENKHYAYLMYVPTVAGANDPTRNYHQPEGGAYLSDDRSHAWATSAWPTTLGVDVKLTVHSWTLPWAHLDDFHLVEVELTNTGEADLNGDGVVDLHHNRINALNLLYWPGCFHFYIASSGGRGYYVNNNRYRAIINDETPDENGAPWDIYCQAIGSPPGTEQYPALTDQGEYYDAYNGYGWLGAKKWNPDTQQWEEKFLCFKDASGNEIVPAIGEGAQRGWFHTNQPGWGNVMDGGPKKAHIASMGAFFVDGGKSNDGAAFDLSPNPAVFASGTTGDPTTFVAKDPSQWTYPDGAWEYTEPRMAVDPESGAQLGMSPMDPASGDRGRPMEPGIITQGLISQYQFDGDPETGIGPFALEVGEKIRLYFYRGSGFRIAGLRKTVKTARAVFDDIQPDGSYIVPQAPPVPEIRVSGSAAVRPVIKWQDPSALGDADGIKIYKCVAWPRYNSTEKLYPTHETWWKTMDPNVDPGQSPINPLFKRFDLLKDQQGDYWGPYTLVKVIAASDYANYKNTDKDASEYPYAYEDETYTAAGQSYWYYVSSYKTGAAAGVPAPFQGLDDATWLESGKVNINGRTGQWEDTWPWAWRTSYYPADTDTKGLQDIGAVFVLVSPTASTSELTLNKANVGVRPNPYKRVAFHDASGKHQVMFYNLPQACTIQIYDLSGMLINEVDYQATTPENGTYFWDMFSKNGNEIASGLYIWVVKYKGGMQHGTFAVIR